MNAWIADCPSCTAPVEYDPDDELRCWCCGIALFVLKDYDDEAFSFYSLQIDDDQ